MRVSDLDIVIGNPSEVVEGTPVKISGRVVIVGALYLGSIRRHKQLLADIRDRKYAGAVEMIEASEPVITDAISRNYPDWTKDHSEQFVDLSNFNEIFSAIMLSSRLVKAVESKPAGEVSPVAAAPDSPSSFSNAVEEPRRVAS